MEPFPLNLSTIFSAISISPPQDLSPIPVRLSSMTPAILLCGINYSISPFLTKESAAFPLPYLYLLLFFL